MVNNINEILSKPGFQPSLDRAIYISTHDPFCICCSIIMIALAISTFVLNKKQ